MLWPRRLLPKLSLFASAGGSASNANAWNVRTSNGGCCGSTVATALNTSGYDWSIGLAARWLMFDAGTTRGQVRALAMGEAVSVQQYAARRNAIRLRLEQAFFNAMKPVWPASFRLAAAWRRAWRPSAMPVFAISRG